MKVLVLTAMWPHDGNPANGAFVSAQVDSLKRAGVEIAVLALTGARRKLAYAQGIFQLRQLLRSNPVDVIHAHYSYAGLLARTQWSVPVVVTFHGDDLLGTVGAHGSLTRMSRINTALSKALARVIDAAVVVNSEMARRLGGIPSHVIPCEVDLQLFRPLDTNEARRQLGLHTGKQYLLFAADPRIPVKRFSLAEAAVRELSRENSAVELLTICREPQSRLCLYLNACDALVFPSYQEGSPTIVKQAMACNLPIVATDVGDVRQLIGSTDGCYICEPSVEVWVAALRRLLRTRRRTTGRDSVAHLDGPVIARKLIEVYKAVINGPVSATSPGLAQRL